MYSRQLSNALYSHVLTRIFGCSILAKYGEGHIEASYGCVLRTILRWFVVAK